MSLEGLEIKKKKNLRLSKRVEEKEDQKGKEGKGKEKKKGEKMFIKGNSAFL